MRGDQSRVPRGEQLQELAAGIQSGWTAKRCATFCGVSLRTYQRWLLIADLADAGPYHDFGAAVVLAGAERTEKLRRKIEDDPDWRAALALLERENPEEYSSDRQLIADLRQKVFVLEELIAESMGCTAEEARQKLRGLIESRLEAPELRMLPDHEPVTLNESREPAANGDGA